MAKKTKLRIEALVIDVNLVCCDAVEFMATYYSYRVEMNFEIS